MIRMFLGGGGEAVKMDQKFTGAMYVAQWLQVVSAIHVLYQYYACLFNVIQKQVLTLWSSGY